MEDPSPPSHKIVLDSSNPATSQIVKALVTDKPLGWSQKSRAPYYKKRFAEWIKKDIDAMLLDRRTRVYGYLKFNLSPNSLYFKINQAMSYLCDLMDTEDGLYATFREDVKIVRRSGVGVILQFHSELESNGAEIVEEDALTKRPRWMDKMDAWLEATHVDGPFIKDNLLLTDAQVAQIKLELSEIKGVMISITNTSVKMMKA